MMSYAQTNYPNVKQGISGKFTIAQIGCFITAFCNIMERFGVGIDPPGLNNLLAARSLYIDVDDNIRDDVGWTTIISAYPNNIRLETLGTGAPTSNDSIVQFKTNGGFGTHFCLVQDAKTGTIIDSWDGKVKSWNVYGGPVAYATYSRQPSAVAVQPQGGNMPAKISLATARILAEEILGRDRIKTHTGGFDSDLNANHVNKDLTNEYVGVLWQSQEAEAAAKLRGAHKDFYDTYSSKIAELSARPTKEELAGLGEALRIEREKVLQATQKLAEVQQTPVDERQVVEGWLKRVWNSLFKKG